MDAFQALAPYIQEYIYANGWQELRAIQVAAIDVILKHQDNLLLSSGTASGKTEAAFLPVLTDLQQHPSGSVAVLYISPLKALINDQFKRLDDLLQASGLKVYKWHGDASQAQKQRLLKKPEGILQITPESLESLLIHKRGACIRLFSDLRYVIIDEVHYFMRDLRGVQVLCQLERLRQLTGLDPRRIGLSATLGDLQAAVDWLGSGSDRACQAPVLPAESRRLRLLMERFAKDGDGQAARPAKLPPVSDQAAPVISAGDLQHYQYLFKMTLGKKTIIFANSREEIELVMANLRQIALRQHAPDVYRVHHGNVSALLREQAEDEMKTSEEQLVTGATVTLELGIDIGSLDQVVQIGAPATVSSFAQRLGRCGRRGQVPQMLFTFVDDVQATAADTLGPINWGFLRAIVIIELYTGDRWLEPLHKPQLPFTLLYHQTMSYLLATGEVSAAELAGHILSLSSFHRIPPADYQLLLRHLLAIGHLQRVEDRDGLIIGPAGEKIVNNFHFLAVFRMPEYYLVKDENRSIGTVDKVYPSGMHFALAGRTWETVDVNVKARTIFVKPVPGISTVDWDVDFTAELHTVLVRKLRQVLLQDQLYPYLSESCRDRLTEIRYLARNSGILQRPVTQLSAKKFAIFPWIGTRQLYTLHYVLLQLGIPNRLPWHTAVYLEVSFRQLPAEAATDPEAPISYLAQQLRLIPQLQLTPDRLPLPETAVIDHKFNEYIPPELLRKEYIADFLDLPGMQRDLAESLALMDASEPPVFYGDPDLNR